MNRTANVLIYGTEIAGVTTADFLSKMGLKISFYLKNDLLYRLQVTVLPKLVAGPSNTAANEPLD